MYNKLLKEYESNLLISCSLRIRGKKIKSFIEEFINENRIFDKEELNLIGLIISISRELYDNDTVPIPLDDLTYDRIIEKFHQYSKNYPSVKVMNGESYDFPNLANNLHKCYYIYEEEKSDNRPSFESMYNKWKAAIGLDLMFPIMFADKKDGLSLALTIKNRKGYSEVIKATTRGDKEKGMNVTKIFKGIKFKEVDFDGEFGLQIEFMVDTESKKMFEEVRGREYKTYRSAAVGLLSALTYAENDDIFKKFQMCMRLAPLNYDMDKSESFDPEIFEKLKCIPDELIIDVNREYVEKCSSGEFFDRLESFILEYRDKREDMNHDIDGVVITVLNKKGVKKLGRKDNTNEFQVAYKFPEVVKKTEVLGLIQDRGKFNYISLLAEVKPVLLNGTTQSKGQIHSLNKFNDMDLSIGDEVYLKHSGDVIPFLIAKKNRKKGNGPKLKLPTHCDICYTELVEENSMLRCKNIECSGGILGRLTTFIERCGIKNIKESKIEKMMNLGISDGHQLLNITENELNRIGITTDKTINLILGEFKRVKEEGIEDSLILASVAVDKLGKRASANILEHISLDDLVAMTSVDEIYNKILSIPGHKDAKARMYADGIWYNKQLLLKLMKDIKRIKVDLLAKKEFDKMILVSGFRDNKDFIKKANEMGYGVSENSWKNVSLLVIANNSYRGKGKANDANKRGIDIKTLEEFMEA